MGSGGFELLVVNTLCRKLVHSGFHTAELSSNILAPVDEQAIKVHFQGLISTKAVYQA